VPRLAGKRDLIPNHGMNRADKVAIGLLLVTQISDFGCFRPTKETKLWCTSIDESSRRMGLVFRRRPPGSLMLTFLVSGTRNVVCFSGIRRSWAFRCVEYVKQVPAGTSRSRPPDGTVGTSAGDRLLGVNRWR
jgi:hypothetical protein